MPSTDEVIIDLTNYKDRVGSRVDPGTYLMTVEDAERDMSRNENVMIVLYLRITGGEFDGSTIVDRLTLSDKAMFRVVNFLQATGAPTPKKRFKMSPSKLVGKKIMAEVDDGEPYNGRVKSEVRGYSKVTAAKAQTNGRGADLDDLDDLEDGTEEFASETTSNPAEEETPARTEETEETEERQVTASAPEEVDLDEVEL